jgi:exopolysaccharide biosynthesis polyprenyl glycosylphosphotransferase
MRAAEGANVNRPESISVLRARTLRASVRDERTGTQAEARNHDVLRRRMLGAADLITATVGSLAIARSGDVGFLWVLPALPGWIVLAKLYGLYDRDHRALRHLTTDELPSLFGWTLTSSVLTSSVVAVTAAGDLAVLPVAAAGWVAATLGAITFRSLARWAWRRAVPPERTLVIGDGPLATAARRKLELFPDIHCVVLPATPDQSAQIRDGGRLPRDVDRVLVATSDLDERFVATLVRACRTRQVKLTVVPPPRGAFGTAVQLKHLADLPLMEYNTWDVSRSTLLLKRTLDLGVAMTALLVLAPLLAPVAVAVKLDSPGPVFFRQRRAGRNGELFSILKFRTMVRNAEELLPDLVALERLPDPMFKLTHDPRVTRLGRVLRRTSVDELPQLVNVLIGEMSLVGPRPEQVELVAQYGAEHRFRLAVKPGLTGPMQVFGRGELAFDERLAVEREYIENLSIGRDLRLLAMTVRAVATGRGAF